MERRHFMGSRKIDLSKYLWITSYDNDFTFSYSKDCYYCINEDGYWKYLPANTTSDAISFDIPCAVKGTDSSAGTFTFNGSCDVRGTPLSMIYGDNVEYDTVLSKYKQLGELFKDCITIKYAWLDWSHIKSITGSFVCQSMFEGCTGLLEAYLDFTNLESVESYCYSKMFNGCTSLVSVSGMIPVVAENSCSNMFYGCTNLFNIPSDFLPATTLASHCYSYMFYECTSLTRAPGLPATTLASYCYQSMFAYCASLKMSGVLLADTLVDSCYDRMFNRCTSLAWIHVRFLTIPSADYMESWVYKVSDSGTIVLNSNITWNPEDYRGEDGIPEGWTITTN